MPEVVISEHTGFAHLTDLPCISLQYGAATAVISLYGAQLLSYKPSAEREVLWLSPKAGWHNGQAIRGGIPICWPWFGPASAPFNPDNNVLPNHGLVRNRLWQLAQQHSSPNGASVCLQLELNDVPHYRGTVLVKLVVNLSDSLSVQLSCNSPMPQQGALHSYFNIGDIGSVLIRPLPAQYLDKVSAKTVAEPQLSTGVCTEVDRIYSDSAAQLRLDAQTGAVAIHQAGHDATIVWNPWQEKSSRTPDLTPDCYQHFVCVESARLHTDSATLSLQQQLKAV